jgi:hypothetical protein
METKEDGYSYFIFDNNNSNPEQRAIIEYKFRKLQDGPNVEAYERDITNQFAPGEFEKIQTMIKPDGTPNMLLHIFNKHLNQHLNQHINQRLVQKPYCSSGVTVKMPKRSQFSLNLRLDLKSVMFENKMNLSGYINLAIAERLERDGLL